MDNIINWDSAESHVFVNPRLPLVKLPSDWEGYASHPGHVWIATSGTTSTTTQKIKWVALSKKALLVSAKAVNQHLKSNQQDTWLNPLPLFHVGGLSILARAILAGAQVIQAEKWSADVFHALLISSKATLTSLVPAQLFDLLERELKPPPFLRGILVGGGRLIPALYEKGIKNGWPLLPTYGMTECGSQVATAKLGDPTLHILSHVDCQVTSENHLCIKSEALLTGYLEIHQETFTWNNPKVEGWYTTQDRVELKNRTLHFLGRQADWIKIGGENVSLVVLEDLFELLRKSIDAVLLAVPDDRLGHKIEVVTIPQHSKEIEGLVATFNSSVMPYERIRQVRISAEIPRTVLGKPLKNQLLGSLVEKNHFLYNG